jgi:HEAT repeat protein
MIRIRTTSETIAALLAGALMGGGLAGCGGSSSPEVLEARQRIEDLRHSNAQTRATAAKRLGELKSKDAVFQMSRMLGDAETEVRYEVIVALGEIGGEDAVEPLCRALHSEEWTERKAAADGLGKIKDPRSIEPLIALLQDENAAAANAGVQALIAIGKPAVAPVKKAAGGWFAGLEAAEKEAKERAAKEKETREKAARDAKEKSEKEAKERKGKEREAKDREAKEREAKVREDKSKPAPGPRRKLGDNYGRRVDDKPLEGSAVIAPELTSPAPRGSEALERAVLVLGEIGDASCIEFLRSLLSCPTLAVRVTAADALIKLGDLESSGILAENLGAADEQAAAVALDAMRRLGKGAIPGLTRAVTGARPEGRLEAVNLLARMDDPRVVVPLMMASVDRDSRVHKRAQAALTPRLGLAETLKELVGALAHKDPAVRLAACETINKTGQVFPVDPVAALLADEKPEIRIAAADALENLGDRAAVEPLAKAAKDANPDVRMAAGKALASMGDRRANDMFLDILKDKNAKLAFQRIAIKALGDSRDERAVDLLLPLLQSKEQAILYASIEALGSIGDKRAVAPLLTFFDSIRTPGVASAARALGQIGDPKVFDTLKNFMGLVKHRFHKGLREPVMDALVKVDPDRAITFLAGHVKDVDLVDRDQFAQICRIFAARRDPRSIPPLLTLFVIDDSEIRQMSAKALKDVGAAHLPTFIATMKDVAAGQRSALAVVLAEIGAPAVAPVLEALKHDAPEIRQGAAWTLGEMHKPEHAGPLMDLVKDKHAEVRAAAAWSLGALKHEPATEPLTLMLNDPEAKPRQCAAAALGLIGGAKAMEALLAAPADKDPTVRVELLKALGRSKTAPARERIQAAIKDEDPTVRKTATDLLKALGAGKGAQAGITSQPPQQPGGAAPEGKP